jgi:hypothetical protein
MMAAAGFAARHGDRGAISGSDETPPVRPPMIGGTPM